MHIEKRNQSGRTTWELHGEGGFIARFPTLEDAARVLRYMAGSNMSDAEQEKALEALHLSEQA